MATRSNIIAKLSDGRWKRIYCHSDGYLSYNGRILFENYDTASKISSMMGPGDMSSLGEKSTKPRGHSFDKRVKGYSVYYGRDRGEKGNNVDGVCGSSFRAVWPEEDAMEEFSYVWDGKVWWVTNGDPDTLTLLEDALKGDALEVSPRTITPDAIENGELGVIAAPPAERKVNPLWGQFA